MPTLVAFAERLQGVAYRLHKCNCWDELWNFCSFLS